MEEVVKELVSYGFFLRTNDAIEIQEAVYLPTQKLRDFAQTFKDIGTGDIDKVEEYQEARR